MAVLGSLTYILGVDRASVQRGLQEVAAFERRLITGAETAGAAYNDLNREIARTGTTLGNIGGGGGGAASETQKISRAITEQAREIRIANNEMRTGTITTSEFAARTEAARGELLEMAESLELNQGQMVRLTTATATATRNLDRGFTDASQAIDDTGQRLRTVVAQFDAKLIDSEEFRRRLGSIETGFRELQGAANLSQRDLERIANGISRVASQVSRLDGPTQTAGERIKNLADKIRIATNQLESGTIDIAEFRREVTAAKTALEGMARAEELTTQETLQLTNATATAQRALNGYRTRIARLGVSYQAQIALQSTILGQLARFGPLGVAASAGMQTLTLGLAQAATAGGALVAALGPITAIIAAVAALGTAYTTSARAAVDLEQRQAEVIKTTNLNAQEILQLTRNLQSVSTRTGTFTKDLVDIASVAGQLGVRGVRNLTLFTDTINNLGIATDVVGEEGATLLAKFLAAVNTSQEDLGETAVIVGDVLNELENSLATTAGEILNTTRFTAQLGSQFDVTKRDILGFSAAINSVGLQAEAAGSGLVRTFRDISQAVIKGGRDLEIFANVSGASVEEFSRLFEEDAGQAVRNFILGLAAIDEAGGNVNAILDTLGATELRQLRTLSTLEGGWRNFALAIEVANDEARTTGSVQREVERRLNTVSGQFRILRARIGVAAQVLGEAFLPILRGFVDRMNDGSGSIGNVVASLTVFVAGIQSAFNVINLLGQVVAGVFNGVNAVVLEVADRVERRFDTLLANLGDRVKDLAVQILVPLPTSQQDLEELGRINRELERTNALLAEIDDRQSRRGASGQGFDGGRGGRTLGVVFEEAANFDFGTTLEQFRDAVKPLTEALANFDEVAAAARGELENLNEEADRAIVQALLSAEGIDLEALSLGNLANNANKAGRSTRTAADVFTDLNAALAAAPRLAEALGSDFNEAEFVVNALTSAITELITEFNFTGADSRLIDLIDQLGEASDVAEGKVSRLRRSLEEALTQRYADLIVTRVDTGDLGIDEAIAELQFQRRKLEQQLADAASTVREGEGGLLDAQSLQRRLQAIEDILLAFEQDIASGAEAVARSRNERAAAAIESRFDSLREQAQASVAAAERVEGAFTSVDDALAKLSSQNVPLTAEVIGALTERFEELRRVNTDLERDLAENLILGVRLDIINPDQAADTLAVEIGRLQQRLDAAELRAELQVDGEVDPLLEAEISVLGQAIEFLASAIDFINGEDIDLDFGQKSATQLAQEIGEVTLATRQFNEDLELARQVAAESGAGFDEASVAVGLLETTISGLLARGISPTLEAFGRLAQILAGYRAEQEEAARGVELATQRNARAAEALEARYGDLDAQIAATVGSVEAVTGRFASMEDATEKLRSQGLTPTAEVLDFLVERFVTLAETVDTVTRQFAQNLRIGVEVGDIDATDAAATLQAEIERLQEQLEAELLTVDLTVRGGVDEVTQQQIDLYVGTIEFLKGLLDEIQGEEIDITIDESTIQTRGLLDQIADVQAATVQFGEDLVFAEQQAAALGRGFDRNSVAVGLLEESIAGLLDRGVDPAIAGFIALTRLLAGYRDLVRRADEGTEQAAARNARAAEVVADRFGDLDLQVRFTLQAVEQSAGAFESVDDALAKLRKSGIPPTLEIIEALTERFTALYTAQQTAAEALAERLVLGVELNVVESEAASQVIQAEIDRLQGELDEAVLSADFTVEGRVNPVLERRIETLRASIEVLGEALAAVFGDRTGPAQLDLTFSDDALANITAGGYADQLGEVALASQEFTETLEGLRRQAELLGVPFDENAVALELLEGILEDLFSRGISPLIPGMGALIERFKEYSDQAQLAADSPFSQALEEFQRITGTSESELSRFVAKLNEFIAAGGPAAELAEGLLDALAPNIAADPLLESVDATLAWIKAQRDLGRITRDEARTELNRLRDALIALNVNYEETPELAQAVADAVIRLGEALKGLANAVPGAEIDLTEFKAIKDAVSELTDERTNVDRLRERILAFATTLTPENFSMIGAIRDLLVALEEAREKTSEFGDAIIGAATSGNDAADSLTRGIGGIVKGIDLLAQGDEPLAAVTLALKGLREGIDSISAQDIGSVLRGAASAAAEVAGLALFGVPGGGDFANTAIGIVEGIVGLFSGQTPASRALSESISSSVQGGVLNAFNSFRRGDIDRTELRSALEESIGDAVFNAALGRLIDTALIAGALKPLLDQISAAIIAGDSALINSLIGQIPGIINRVLPTLIGAAERLGAALDTYLPGNRFDTDFGDDAVFDRIPDTPRVHPDWQPLPEAAALTESIASLERSVSALTTRGVRSKVDLSIENHSDFATVIRSI